MRISASSGLAVIAAIALVAAACSPDAGSPTTVTRPPAATTSEPAITAGPATNAPSSVTAPTRVPADAPVEERVADVMSRMTLAEKIGQMTLVEKNSMARSDIARRGIGGILSGGGGSPLENTPEAWAEMINGFQEMALESRLGIPLLYGVDAVHGHSNVRGAVIFPHNIGLGAANDPELMERIGRITALEMTATGAFWNYAPAVSVPQDIRWGRTYEGYSEDTAVVTELATAYLRGLQGTDLTMRDAVLATPKHYVGDGGTRWGTSTTANYWIDQGVTEIDEDELRAVHLPPYIEAIEAGALSIMASYSSWGGEKMHAQQYLLTDVLKDELGFDGFIVSDWAGIDQISDDYSEAVIRAINAGIDMNMVPGDYPAYIDALTAAVESGAVSMERIDDAVRRVLTAKFELGLFEFPYGDDSLLAAVGSAEHRAVAREAVAKSAVLLKNEDAMLPLDPAGETLYVGGGAADNIGIQSGGWTISWQGGSGATTEGTSILDGIRAAVSADTTVVYERSGEIEPSDSSEVTCIAVAGELPYAEGFGDDGDPMLLASDKRMLDTMAQRCDSLAVIIISGRPLLVADQIDDWDAVVAVWLPGSEGAGVADVLFGTTPFTGTLPYTWPRTVEQLPANSRSGVDDPLFPLGHGIVTG